MVSTKLAVILTVAAAVAFASPAVVTTTSDDKILENTVGDNKGQLAILSPDFTNFEHENNFNNGEIHAIPTKDLRGSELPLDVNDNVFTSDLVAKKVVNAGRNVEDSTLYGKEKGVSPGRRQKRQIGAALRIIVRLLKNAVKSPRVTTSGRRITQQFTKRGNYQTALNDFREINPQNVKSFSQGGISGQTGTVGNMTVTVRNGSKQGAPTLEIRSSTPNGGELVRKVRYDE